MHFSGTARYVYNYSMFVVVMLYIYTVIKLSQLCPYIVRMWFRCCIDKPLCIFRTLFSDEFSNFVNLSAPELVLMFERYNTYTCNYVCVCHKLLLFFTIIL